LESTILLLIKKHVEAIGDLEGQMQPDVTFSMMKASNSACSSRESGDGSLSSLGTEKGFLQVYKQFAHMYILDKGFTHHSTCTTHTPPAIHTPETQPLGT
jgi:hypothetical protein